MNRKPVILVSIGAGVFLLALACVFWFTRPAVPTIRFVEYKDPGTERQVAIFRITNNSRGEFSYLGGGANNAQYVYRIDTPDGWQTESLGWCGLGYGIVSIPPHSEKDIEVWPPSDGLPPSYAVGVRFYRGNMATPPTGMKLYFAYGTALLQRVFYPQGPPPTWSDLAPFPPEAPVTRSALEGP